MTRKEMVDHKIWGREQATSIAPEQLNGQSQEIVLTYISEQIYESAFLPSGEKRGGRNIYNVLLTTKSHGFRHLFLLFVLLLSKTLLLTFSLSLSSSSSYLETHCCNFLVWDLYAAKVRSVLISVWNVTEWQKKSFQSRDQFTSAHTLTTWHRELHTVCVLHEEQNRNQQCGNNGRRINTNNSKAHLWTVLPSSQIFQLRSNLT